MYGQGSYAPQFRPGPQAPPQMYQQPPRPGPPQYQQVPPGPPLPQPNYQQAPPGPPPQSYPQVPQGMQHAPVYQHGPPPPQQSQMNLGQGYMQAPPPSYGNQGQYLQQPMQMPPRMLPPPPPPPHSQVLYRTPQPPPAGFQPVIMPPPPPPLVTPTHFASFTPVGAAPLPPCPASPAPLPPSSPPPPPPPPPPPSMAALKDDSEKAVAAPADKENVAVDGDNVGGVDDDTENTRLIDGEESRLPSPPPKPDDDVVQTIEDLCKYITECGPDFETFARKKESANPEFAFLFGGPPGSDAAIGQEYYQWMRRNYQLIMTSRKDSDEMPASPVVSDMDMEVCVDDVSPDGDRESDHVTKLSTREQVSGSNLQEPRNLMEKLDSVCLTVSDSTPYLDSAPFVHDAGDAVDSARNIPTTETISGSNEMNIINPPLHGSESIMELEPVVAVSGSCSVSLPFSQDAEDDKDLPLSEEVSHVRALPESADGVLEDILQQQVVSSPSDSNIYQDGGKINQNPRVFVKDGSPFRLIQGYASDDSDEATTREKVEDVKVGRVMPKEDSNAEPANFSLTEVEVEAAEHPTSVANAIPPGPKETEHFTDSPKKTSVSPITHSSQLRSSDDTIGILESPRSNELVNQVKKMKHEDVKGTVMPDVDEFGRLVRQGSSESDSDRRHSFERSGKRGRNTSRSRSPRESKWRRRSRSPRRRGRPSHSPRSPGTSRSKSPPASRRINIFARWERDQPPVCFNFIRGRCFRGTSCRYVHNDQQRSRQQQHPEYPQDSRNYDMHAGLPVSKNAFIDKVISVKESDDTARKEVSSPDRQSSKDLPEASMTAINNVVLVENNASGSVLEDAESPAHKNVGEMEVTNQISTVLISDVQEPEVENDVKRYVPSIEEEKLLPVPDSCQHDSLPIQPFVGKSQSLFNETDVQQKDSSEGTYTELAQPNSVLASTPEQGQNATHHTHADDHMLSPSPVRAIQSTPNLNQTPASQLYSSLAPEAAVYPSRSPMPQPHSNYASKDFPPPSLSAPGSNLPSSPLLPPAPNEQSPATYPTGSAFPAQYSREFILPPVLGDQPQRPPLHLNPSHGPPVTSDCNPLKAPPNPAWPNLPPPPPRPQNVSSLPGWPSFLPSDSPVSQFQQNVLPPRSDFNPAMRPIASGDLQHIQVPDARRFYSELQPPLHTNEFRQMPLPVRNQLDQPFARDGRFPHPQMADFRTVPDSQRDYHLHHQPFLRETLPGHGVSQSVVMHPQSMPFSREPMPNRQYSFPEETLPPRFLPREQFSHTLDFSRQPQYLQQQPTNCNVSMNGSIPGIADAANIRYPSLLPTVPISTHYNPYASTFEQTPANFNIGPGAPGRETNASFSNIFETSANSGHVPVAGPGSRITVSPSNYSVSGEQLSRTDVNPPEAPADMVATVQKSTVRDFPTGDAYDPLFDSIEPSINAFNKEDHTEGNSNILDVETSKQKKVMAKLEADELGEGATDAEVGAVENGSPLLADGRDWSPGLPAGLESTAAGEIEIDQPRSPGKSKKSKDSRSMKLFKIAIAEFVKQVLKPSWRQGNMSKEAFKTIVKKTVEKVSGAMPIHQVPKTQAKINQFIDSSRPKLTKLVKGYVDKYVKA